MAIQDINEASVAIQGPGNPTPKSDDDKIIQMLSEMMDEGKKSRSRYDQDWDTNWKYYNGKQWDDQARAAYRAKPVINIIRQTIQAQLPILTDNKPGFDVMPQEPQDSEIAEILSKATAYWWDKYQNDAVVIDAALDSMVTDVGIIKVTWDENLEAGAGDIKMVALDPKDVWTNRTATDFRREDGWKWTIHEMHKTVGELKLLYPKIADRITADDSSASITSNESRSVNTVTLVSPTDHRDDRGQTPPTNAQDDRKTCRVWECWMDDDTVEEYVLTKDDGTQDKELRKKFPRGRLITVLPNKKLVCQDVENPYKHRECPFIKTVDNMLPRSFCGEGEAKALMEVQRLLNKTAANIVDYMTLMSNAIWKVKVGATDNPENITNRAGLLVLINDGYDLSDIQREIPPALPANATQFYDVMWDTAGKISGASELSQGRMSSGDPTAGYAIVQLQEAAQTRIRLKERNLQRCLSQVGKQVIALMMQFYRAPRMTKITGKDGWPEYFEFFFEETEDGLTRMNKKSYNRVEDKKYVPDNENTISAPTKGVFDVKVVAGSSMPFAKAQRDNMAFKLFEGQIIDGKEVLKTLEWPNAEEIEKRMADAQAQQAPVAPPQG
jgi:hypothetical protein